jgi:MbtH protein
MSDLFEQDGSQYIVLINDEGQYSLWPQPTAVPAGWRVVFGPNMLDPCKEYIRETWIDMRPLSLQRAMGS